MTDWMQEDSLSIAAAVRRGRVSAVAVAEQSLARIAARDPQLNCFTAVWAERALSAARRIDGMLDSGGDPGPLAGVPFAVKNMFDVEGEVTLAGSKIRREAPPAQADATLVARLRAAGAVLVGALNMDEYAYGFTTENAHYGPTRNPHDPERVAGGSSGGSGAALAAGMVPLTLGSDTNGSIRVPASFCGVFGLKPTFGRLSRAGSFPFVHSLDHVGPLARSALDLALAYDVMQGPDPADPACAQRARDPLLRVIQQPGRGLRAAVLDGWFRDSASAEALDAVDRVADALGAGRRIVLPEAERARAAAFCITAAEGGALHRADLQRRAGDFDPATRDRLIAGALLPAGIVLQAQRLRSWFRAQLRAVFDEVDILLAPCTPVAAPLVGQPTIRLGAAEVPTRPNIGVYTQPVSFVGLPVVAVPVRRPGALPIGVQVIAAPWREEDALRVAAALEQGGVVGASPA